MRQAAILIVLALTGCSGTPSSPSSGVLTGTWRIVSIQSGSQPAETAPAGTTYEVAFDGARLSARVDCNVCNGSFMMNGSVLTISPALACTRAACATAAFETAVVTLLPGEHRISTTSTTLTLDSPRGRVTLARQ